MALDSLVILQDCDGRLERRRALRSVHPFVRVVCPEDRPSPGARSIPIPWGWLPQGDVPRKCWWKADAMALAAAVELDITADFYWFIESDVAATSDVWRRLFAIESEADLLATDIGRRGPSSKFRHWRHHGTPPDATRHHIMAVYRLSRMALEMSIAMAPMLRETFSEVAVPYVILKKGMSMAELTGFSSPSTMRVRPSEVRIDRRYLNHPLKHDSFEP